jgi:hydrogenase nickel incorporation protein HypA/HybF
MHEFTEMQAMLQQVLEHCPPGGRVTRLRIVVGEASGHDTDHIEQHFREASRGTTAEGATLEFLSEGLSARCASCGTEYRSDELCLCCASCGETRLVITAGDRVYLAGVEVNRSHAA